MEYEHPKGTTAHDISADNALTMMPWNVLARDE
jgi:hypothetical protein